MGSIDPSDLAGSIDEVIDYLTGVKKHYSTDTGYENIRLVVDQGDYSDHIEFAIWVDRLETEKEQEKRLADIKRKRERKAAQKKKLEEKELAELARLRAKYGK